MVYTHVSIHVHYECKNISFSKPTAYKYNVYACIAAHRDTEPVERWIVNTTVA
jgi:hypothetical protein